MTIVDSDKVKERLGILPSQVIDYKALVGDSSDNYPGFLDWTCGGNKINPRVWRF